MITLAQLGEPLPSDDHGNFVFLIYLAVSVSLPTWNSIVGYELGDVSITSRMKMGYPRFLFHPKVFELFDALTGKYGESCLVFPNLSSADECIHYIQSKTGSKSKLEQLEMIGLQFYGVFFPLEIKDVAKEFWQHTGTGISSRFAEAILSNNSEYFRDMMKNDHLLKDSLKKRISSFIKSEYIYLFPSGIID